METTALNDHEQIVYCKDAQVGLDAMIALHSTALGPATGGCRMYPYRTRDEALKDVLRLSRGMTFKAALANLPLGGGKAVMIGDPRTQKSRALLERFGEFIEELKGKFITGKDVGIESKDLEIIRSKTPFVLGIEGESGGSGNPSPATAWGVYHGIKAAAKHVYQTDALTGMTVAVQGLGSVGYHLVDLLVSEGVHVVGCDVNEEAVTRAVRDFKIRVFDAEKIYDVPCDVFSPCALGATMNVETIPRLKTKLVAGGANNQLANSSDDEMLQGLGISYIPDYVINAGGLINCYYDYADRGHYNRDVAYQHIARIADTVSELLAAASATKKPASAIADDIARQRIAAKGQT